MVRGWKFWIYKVEELYYNLAKTKALISFAFTAKLICAFVFSYANCWFSHAKAHMINQNLHSETWQTFIPMCPYRSRYYFLWVNDILPPVPHRLCSFNIFRNKKFSLWIADSPVQCEDLRLKAESGCIWKIPGKFFLETKTYY